MRGAGAGAPPKVSGGGGGGCRRAATRGSARPMLPAPRATERLDQTKLRALTTIYAPRQTRARKNKTAHTRAMLDNEIPVKPTLSPFNPLPAIGKTRSDHQTKVIVFDLNKNETLRPATMEGPIKLHELKTLTPLRLQQGCNRKSSLDSVEQRKPQQLLRENTYDVIEPLYVTANIKKRDSSLTRKSFTTTPENLSKNSTPQDGGKASPKTRFKQAALHVAKLSSLPETGKLLCLRERETTYFCLNAEDTCRLQDLPQSPKLKLTKLSEIFQSLDMKGRHRDKMKKENSWF